MQTKTSDLIRMLQKSLEVDGDLPVALVVSRTPGTTEVYATTSDGHRAHWGRHFPNAIYGPPTGQSHEGPTERMLFLSDAQMKPLLDKGERAIQEASRARARARGEVPYLYEMTEESAR